MPFHRRFIVTDAVRNLDIYFLAFLDSFVGFILFTINGVSLTYLIAAEIAVKFSQGKHHHTASENEMIVNSGNSRSINCVVQDCVMKSCKMSAVKEVLLLYGL